MTEPSQYFKGRTVQEQMDEVIGYVDVRSAEVATTAIASDVAQVHQDMLDADADASAAAASAAAAAGTLANAVKKTGETSQSIAGDIAVAGDLTGGTVTVPTPVNNTDAATKKYVDDADALKADKTYVDAQDALKINISDINMYAVGLSGNQTAIAGNKTWTGYITFLRSSPIFAVKSDDIETGVTPTTSRSFGIQMMDKNGSDIGGYTQYHASNGISQMLFAMVNPTTSDKCTLHVQMNADTTISVYIDTPDGRRANIASLPARP